MRNCIRLLLALALVAGAQTVNPVTLGFTATAEMVPGAVPTSLTCLVGPQSTCVLVIKLSSTSSDPYVCSVDLTGTGQSIAVQDGQSTPVPMLNGVLGSGGARSSWLWTASQDSYCRQFPGGVFIQADGAGATAHFIIKYRK